MIAKIQLGKNGITENFISTLKTHFDKHNNVKVHVLKSAGRYEIKNLAEEILTKLGKNYTAKILGFVINLKKWRKNMRV